MVLKFHLDKDRPVYIIKSAIIAVSKSRDVKHANQVSYTQIDTVNGTYVVMEYVNDVLRYLED